MTLDDLATAKPVSLEDVLTVDIALARLRKIDPVKAELLELRFFGGLTMTESAEVLGLGLTTTKEHFRVAKAWLNRELSSGKNSS